MGLEQEDQVTRWREEYKEKQIKLRGIKGVM